MTWFQVENVSPPFILDNSWVIWVQTKPIDCVLEATDVHKKCVHYLNPFHFLFLLSKHEKETLKKNNFAIEMFCKAWLYPAHPFWQLVTLFLLLKLQKLEIKDAAWAPLSYKSANRRRWTLCRGYPTPLFAMDKILNNMFRDMTSFR